MLKRHKETCSGVIKNHVGSSAATIAANEKMDEKADANVTVNVYPNPFQNNTTIDLVLKEAGKTTMEVFDMQQRRVAYLVNSYLQQGTHRTVFDSKDSSGRLCDKGAA